MEPTDFHKQRAYIKEQYEALAENPAIVDLLARIDENYSLALSKATSELENPSKAQAQLQYSLACDTIRRYIREQIS